jgi:hypothetical protein
MVVNIIDRRSSPVDELDPGLQRRATMTHPLLLGQAEVVEEDSLQVRNRRLANADRGNRRRFHNRNLDLLQRPR